MTEIGCTSLEKFDEVFKDGVKLPGRSISVSFSDEEVRERQRKYWKERERKNEKFTS